VTSTASNLACLSQCQNLLALLAIVASAGCLFHEDVDDLVAGALCEGLQVSLLPFTRLVVRTAELINLWT
jgi:hypothetical protein